MAADAGPGRRVGGGGGGGAGGDGDGVAAGALQGPRRRPRAAAVPQEQAGLLPAPRDRAALQHGAAGAVHGGVLGQDPGRTRRHAGAPGRRVGVVGRRRRRLHRHGLLPPAAPLRRPQPGGVRVGAGGVRGAVMGGAERRRVSHPQLPVVAGPDGRVGADGARVAGVRAVGEDAAGGAGGEAQRRVGRPVGARVPAVAAPGAGAVVQRHVPRVRLLLPGVLGGDRGPPRRRRGAVRGRGARRGRARAPTPPRGARAPPVRGGAARGGEAARREWRRRPWARRRRAEGVAAPLRDALHGLPALRRRAQPDVHAEAVRRGDPPRAGVRGRPGAPRIRVPTRRAAQRQRRAAAVRLPRRALMRVAPAPSSVDGGLYGYK